ncbi:low molecular weight phosphotyrosine protein phosphatase [Actinomyces sp. oral taxon 170 str. F0386]|nr:low molecular weight phosphotyrosine protein phosphatase [Actinomyces sp. oral taxon 170 str. F0386]
MIMVCTGNICRSAMAEIVLGDRLAAAGIPGSGPGGVVVTSAGVSDEERGNPIDSRARRVLAEAGYGTGADDVSRATGIAITSHTAHRITDAEIAEADLLLAMTDSHWNVLQHRATTLEVEPSRIRMYRELDPAASQQVEAVTTGQAFRGVLNVPDPWYGTMADFVDTLEVVERVSDELADELAALLG